MNPKYFLATWLVVCSSADACGFEEGDNIKLNDGQVLHYRLTDPPLVPARHFGMQFQVCRGASAVAVEGFKIDAIMPRHGHGMNYRAEVKNLKDALIEADGMLFHMPGMWQVKLEFRSAEMKHRVELEYRI